MSLHSEHCRNEETFFISVPCETLHTDFLLVFSLFYPSTIFVDFFYPVFVFFFLISLVPSTEKTRSIDVTTSLRIVTFQSVFIRIDRSLLPLLPYFLFLPLLIISFLSISYTDSERTILLPTNFRFFFFFFLISRPLRRYEMWLRLRCARKNVRKAWSCIAWIKKLFNQSKGSLAWREGRDLSRNRIAADRAYLCRRAINPRRDNASYEIMWKSIAISVPINAVSLPR